MDQQKFFFGYPESFIYNLICGALAFGTTFITLLQFPLPYGKHHPEGYKGWEIPAKWGWFLMETPALYVTAYFFLVLGDSAHLASPLMWAIYILFNIHYIHRSIIFPFKLQHGKPMHVRVVIAAFVYQFINGYLQGRWLGYFADLEQNGFGLSFIVGLVLFFGGMYVNIKSDYALIALKKKGKGYQIPHGGAFEYVSAPNLFAEMIEWGGFALCSQSPGALSFFLSTVFDLSPRAVATHKYYKKTFGDKYPKNRKALIPFVY